MSQHVDSNGNGRSIMKLTVPLPVFAAMFVTGISIAIAVYAKLDCISSSIQEIKRDMVVQDDFAWYTKQVAKMNPGHPIPDVSEYFREKRTGFSADVGVIK